MSVGSNFYGVFSASNAPIMSNFPRGVTYQRNANFATNQLRNLANTANVSTSIDPYFFAAEQISLVLDTCLLRLTGCLQAQLERGFIKIKCRTEPCVAVDPVPKNCLVKFDCPGCGGPNVLCPPYYHIFIDDIDPAQWDVELVHRNGKPVPHEISRTPKGIAISFRPDKDKFQPRRIGDYFLVFNADKLTQKKNFDFPVRLEVSDFQFGEHIRGGRP
jgi:hypothetical protein